MDQYEGSSDNVMTPKHWRDLVGGVSVFALVGFVCRFRFRASRACFEASLSYRCCHRVWCTTASPLSHASQIVLSRSSCHMLALVDRPRPRWLRTRSSTSPCETIAVHTRCGVVVCCTAGTLDVHHSYFLLVRPESGDGWHINAASSRGRNGLNFRRPAQTQRLPRSVRLSSSHEVSWPSPSPSKAATARVRSAERAQHDVSSWQAL